MSLSQSKKNIVSSVRARASADRIAEDKGGKGRSERDDYFRSIITRSKVTPNQLKGYTFVDYQSKPDYLRAKLYEQIGQDEFRS